MIIKINLRVVTLILLVCVIAMFGIIGAKPKATVKTAVTEAETSGKRFPIVMYHHILETESRWGDYVISPSQFEQDLKYIKECGYQTVTTVQLLNYVSSGTPLPENPIMITFDDAFESVYKYAYPLLAKYDMTAVVAVLGKHTDLFSDENEPKHINYSHLSWNELREMQQSGRIEVQNHTYDMHDSGNGGRKGIRIKQGEDQMMYEQVLVKDIGGLSKQIEREIGVKPTTFAFPFGALCKESNEVLKELEFKLFLTCSEKVRQVKVGETLPITMGRFNRAHKYSTADFFKKMGVTQSNNKE